MASNKMLIDASHPEETRVVVLRGNRIEEFDFESQNKRQLKGNIYLAKVTRVEPSLQAAFVDYGGNRHGFLAFNEIHPDYYQIPVADRQALLDEEAADARRDNGEDDLDRDNGEKPADEDESAQAPDDDEDAAPDVAVAQEGEPDEKPNRRKRRPRRKSAASKKEENSEEEPAAVVASDDEPSNSDDNPSDEGASDADETPTSMAAMMETDSISEPAPDEEPSQDDDGSQEDTSAEPVTKRRRSTRRPRKKAKAEVAAAEEETSTPEADEKADASAAETASVEADAEQGEEAPKPKTRRRRKPTRSRGKKDADAGNGNNGNGNNGNGDDVESVGQSDASEELPPRRRSRRQYKIQEVIKRRQVLLVQVVKEERGNKGAALTTYLSLAGRYSVLMPNTARGGGISRKITNAPDRKRLKAIASGLEVPDGMGVILRTAGASRDSDEIQRDFEYLMRLWEQVRELTLSSSAPCLVYEEGSLIKRSIRDLYDKNTGEIQVAGESGFKEARAFMEMLMPSHTSKVKFYQDEQAMFARFGVETQLDKMLSQQVTLKSGGYLVIDQTEALVAIDVNSGRATREHSIEETALQTNLETAEEVARQLRLRDLAGLIVIDFIDMEENRNNRAVEKKLKECLKHDRARIQVGRISHFGLMEMSRQRMRASVLDSTMDVCAHCQGKGHIRANPSVGLHILRSIEEHLLKNSKFDIIVRAASDIALYMLNHKRQALMEIEARFGLKIFIEGNRDLLGENFTIEKGEPAVGERVPISHIQVGQVSDVETEVEDNAAPTDDDTDQAPKRKRRRRRSRGKTEENGQDEGSETTAEVVSSEPSEEGDAPAKPKRSRGKRGGRNSRKPDAEQAAETVNGESVNGKSDDDVKVATETKAAAAPQEDEAPAPRSRNSRPRKAKPKTARATEEPAVEAVAPAVADVPEAETPSEPAKPKRRATKRRPAKTKAAAAGSESVVKSDEPKAENQEEKSSAAPAKDADAAAGEEKKGGWWSRNGFFS